MLQSQWPAAQGQGHGQHAGCSALADADQLAKATRLLIDVSLSHVGQGSTINSMLLAEMVGQAHAQHSGTQCMRFQAQAQHSRELLRQRSSAAGLSSFHNCLELGKGGSQRSLLLVHSLQCILHSLDGLGLKSDSARVERHFICLARLLQCSVPN